MKIQLNTDVHIEGAEAMERFSEHVTRAEVHLSDENGSKSGQPDPR